MREKIYIFYRKTKASFSSLWFYLFRIFPIKKNLVSVCAFEGKGGFGCNPKYIVQELHKKNPDIEFVWFLNSDAMGKEMPAYIRKVPNTLISRAYWLTRSKVWIDNYRKPLGTVKRKGQYYLNTNHYTLGIKTVGLWRGKGFSKMAYLVSKNDSDMIDDLIIDSKFGEIISPRGLLYDGPYLKTGAPRCDVLFGNREEQKRIFRRKHHLPEDVKIVMYAPTFREGAHGGKRYVYSRKDEIDFKRVLENLEERFGGQWCLCFRVHPQLAEKYSGLCEQDNSIRIIDESQADDMYEVLAAMDAYITDYSSACFEAGFAKIPTFIYAEDIEKYVHDRGALFWNLASKHRHHIERNLKILKDLDVEFPFSVARTNDELERDVQSFQTKQYTEKLDLFHERIGLVFSGNASELIADRIIKMMRLK